MKNSLAAAAAETSEVSRRIEAASSEVVVASSEVVVRSEGVGRAILCRRRRRSAAGSRERMAEVRRPVKSAKRFSRALKRRKNRVKTSTKEPRGRGPGALRA